MTATATGRRGEPSGSIFPFRASEFWTWRLVASWMVGISSVVVCRRKGRSRGDRAHVDLGWSAAVVKDCREVAVSRDSITWRQHARWRRSERRLAISSHALISAIAPILQQTSRDALAQLVSAELICRRGTRPDAEYTLKHQLRTCSQ